MAAPAAGHRSVALAEEAVPAAEKIQMSTEIRIEHRDIDKDAVRKKDVRKMSFSAEVKEELFHQTGRGQALSDRGAGGFYPYVRRRFCIRRGSFLPSGFRTENVWVARKYAFLLKKIV